MIAAKYRFHGYGALKFLFGHGKTYRFSVLSLRVAHNQRRQHSRVSVVVGKKVLRAAPKRNRARRRIYEVVRACWPHIAPSQDILLSVHDPHVLEMTHEQLLDEITQALKAAKIWHDTPVAAGQPTKSS